MVDFDYRLPEAKEEKIAPHPGGQTLYMASEEFEVLFGGAAGPGKLIPLDIPTPTIEGWKNFGDIHPGDIVFTDKGIPVKVIWESIIEHNPDAYEIEFDSGEKIIANSEHLWKTYNEKERTQAYRLTDEFRDKRRKNRKSRSKENPRNLASQKNITKLNKIREYDYLKLPEGTIRDTKEIFNTQKIRGRNNHSIKNTSPIQIPYSNLSIDPYLFGLWLGDGHKNTGKIGMTVQDMEECLKYTPEKVEKKYYDKRERKTPYIEVRIFDLTTRLKKIGVLDKKHIPIGYLRSSFEQRLLLLAGLMDTDGYCDKFGRCEISLSNKQLSENVFELISSLGIKGTCNKRSLSNKNKNHKDSYRIAFTSSLPVFKLKRKLERQKLDNSIKTKHRYIVSVKKCSPVPMKCIKVDHPDGMFLITKSFIPTHNTFALVLDALGLQYEKGILGVPAIQIPQYRAVLFRRQTTQLADIIDECKAYYPDFGGKYIAGRKGDPGVSFNFPKYYTKGGTTYKTYTEGARIFLCHLNEEKDKENHHGFEYQFVGFDELTQFLYPQYIYLFSRCRSTIPHLNPRIRATSNPVGIGLPWVKKRFIPHIEANRPRFFISDMLDERNLRGIETDKNHPDALSRIYIPGKLKENLTLQERDPGYAARIKAMGPKMARALLESDWNVMEGQFFDNWNQDVHIIHEKQYLSYQQLREFEIIGVIDYGRIMVFSLLAKDYNGNVVLFDQFTSIGDVRQVRVERIKKYLAIRGMSNILILGDTDMWIPDAFDLANQEEPARAFLAAGIRLQKVSKKSTEDLTYRIACNVAVRNGLHYEIDLEGKLIKSPKFKVYSRCADFINTFPSLPVDEDNPEDIDGGDDDHWYDSFKMGYMVINKPKKEVKQDVPQWMKDMIEANKRKEKSFMAV